ncbi:MAG: redoxin domain-containing protein [Armatimonadetes bacterium]|nr:redoxin domain-containing protein [Armatimonadota bacterium]
MEYPHIELIHQQRDKELQVVGIARELRPSAVKTFQKHWQVPFPVLLDTEDKATHLFEASNGVFFILTPDGKVARRGNGFDAEKAVEAFLTEQAKG